MVKHGTLRARLIKASPVHPTKKAVNNWTVQFMDEHGAPLEDVEVAAACAYMPVHQHGTGPLNGTKMLSEPGQFELDYLNFIMRGPWEVQLVLNRAAPAASDMDASTKHDPGAAMPMEFTGCDRDHRHPGTEYAVFPVCVADE